MSQNNIFKIIKNKLGFGENRILRQFYRVFFSR